MGRTSFVKLERERELERELERSALDCSETLGTQQHPYLLKSAELILDSKFGSFPVLWSAGGEKGHSLQ